MPRATNGGSVRWDGPGSLCASGKMSTIESVEGVGTKTWPSTSTRVGTPLLYAVSFWTYAYPPTWKQGILIGLLQHSSAFTNAMVLLFASFPT